MLVANKFILNLHILTEHRISQIKNRYNKARPHWSIYPKIADNKTKKKVKHYKFTDDLHDQMQNDEWAGASVGVGQAEERFQKARKTKANTVVETQRE